MDSIIERLNGQIEEVVSALRESKEEVARMKEQLRQAKALCEEKDLEMQSMREGASLNSMELEDLNNKIAAALVSINDEIDDGINPIEPSNESIQIPEETYESDPSVQQQS